MTVDRTGDNTDVVGQVSSENNDFRRDAPATPAEKPPRLHYGIQVFLLYLLSQHYIGRCRSNRCAQIAFTDT
jgi:hypothetical protein